MKTSKSARYTICDAYPKISSPFFSEYVGAVVGIWVRADRVGTERQLVETIADTLAAAGWVCASIEASEIVSGTSYSSKPEGRDLFEECLRRGISIHFHRRRREVFGGRGPLAHFDRALYERAVKTLGDDGGFSLYSAKDEQWANGVTPDGDDFLPIWLSATDARKWIPAWPGYGVDKLDVDEMVESFLDQVNHAKMWVALGIDPRTLITTHAVELRDTLAASRNRPPMKAVGHATSKRDERKASRPRRTRGL